MTVIRAGLAYAVRPLVQVAQARSQAEQAEAAARASAAQARTAEDMVAAERKRLSQLYSSGLDDLPPQELAVLADVHRTGLQHIQSLQVEHASTLAQHEPSSDSILHTCCSCS